MSLSAKHIEEVGGPSSDDYAQVRRYVAEIGEHADVLLYRVEGETSWMAGIVVDALAVPAFAPRSVKIAGMQFVTDGESQGDLTTLSFS